jgi:hypothetical protein
VNEARPEKFIQMVLGALESAAYADLGDAHRQMKAEMLKELNAERQRLQHDKAEVERIRWKAERKKTRADLAVHRYHATLEAIRDRINTILESEDSVYDGEIADEFQAILELVERHLKDDEETRSNSSLAWQRRVRRGYTSEDTQQTAEEMPGPWQVVTATRGWQVAKEWKVVAVWADENGTETEQVDEFNDYGEAVKKVLSLRQYLGEHAEDGKILFSLRIDGDRRRAFRQGRW